MGSLFQIRPWTRNQRYVSVDDYNTLVRAVQDMSRVKNQPGFNSISNIMSVRRSSTTPALLAVVYSWELFVSGTPRWKYGWKQGVIQADGTISLVEEGLQGGPNTTNVDDYAINLIESNNVPIGGVQGHSLVDGDSTYWTMTTLPIGAGELVGGESYGLCARAVPILLETRADAGGYPRRTFSIVNSVDVTCIPR